jgi:hypothetical protein
MLERSFGLVVLEHLSDFNDDLLPHAILGEIEFEYVGIGYSQFLQDVGALVVDIVVLELYFFDCRVGVELEEILVFDDVSV